MSSKSNKTKDDGFPQEPLPWLKTQYDGDEIRYEIYQGTSFCFKKDYEYKQETLILKLETPLKREHIGEGFFNTWYDRCDFPCDLQEDEIYLIAKLARQSFGETSEKHAREKYFELWTFTRNLEKLLTGVRKMTSGTSN